MHVDLHEPPPKASYVIPLFQRALAPLLAAAMLACSPPKMATDPVPDAPNDAAAVIVAPLEVASSSAAPGTDEPAAVAAVPLGGDRFRSLEVPGFADAVIAAPTTATGKRPVLVATHGNYDTPDWQCKVWGGIVGERGFVLCPRGVRRGDSPSKDDPRFEYASNLALQKEIEQGLAALYQAFPDHADRGAIVFAGFSLGAIMGVSIAARKPELMGGMVLIEGGDKWTVATAKKLAAKGAPRVLFACSQGSCAANAKGAITLLQRAGLEADLAKGKNEGHTYGGDVLRAYGERFSWVVERDGRWAAP